MQMKASESKRARIARVGRAQATYEVPHKPRAEALAWSDSNWVSNAPDTSPTASAEVSQRRAATPYRMARSSRGSRPSAAARSRQNRRSR